MTAPAGARVRRRPLQDLYVEGGAAAVMVDSVVVVLSPLATEVVRRVGEEWVPVEDVVAHLVAGFGAPEDGSALDATLALLGDLAAQRVLDLDGTAVAPPASGTMAP